MYALYDISQMFIHQNRLPVIWKMLFVTIISYFLISTFKKYSIEKYIFHSLHKLICVKCLPCTVKKNEFITLSDG